MLALFGVLLRLGLALELGVKLRSLTGESLSHAPTILISLNMDDFGKGCGECRGLFKAG